MELSKNTQHWIAPNALTIGLNFDGMPDYIQVSVLANAVILSYIEGVIGYDQSHNYRKWYISAFNTKLSSAAAHYVYARLDKGGTTALIVYDTLARNIYGATDINPDYQDENYYYVYLGKISPNYDESTLASKARIWEDGIHYGMLSTPESPYQSIQVENDIRLSPTSAIIIGDACLKYDAKNKALYTEYKNGDPLSFYTTGGSSAKGISPKGESEGGGASALYQLNDVLKNATEDGVQGAEKDKVLMFNGTHWYAGDAKGKVVAVKVGQDEYKPSEEGIVTLPEFAKVVDKSITVDKFIGALEGNADTATKLKNALTIQKNKTEIGVFDGSETKTVNIDVPTKVSELENDSKFLTEHQKLYALTIQGNGKQLGVYTPNEAAKSINITPSGIGAAASSHTHAISDVTNLQASLDSKLNASIFTELFEKVLLSDGVTYAIRAKYGFYSDSFVSAKGANSSTGGSEGGAASIYVGSTLYTPDGEGIIHLPAYPVVPTALKNPYALTIQRNGITQGVYDGSAAKTVNITVPTKVSELNNDANYLTSHQTLYALTIQGNGTELGVYTPNAAAKSINITAAGIGAAAATHKQAYTADECTTYSTDDNTMGVTPAAVKKAIGLFEPKAHTHNSLGTLTAGSSSHPVYFNAGVPTAVDKTATFNAFVNSIAVGFDAPTDADYYISQYVGGGTENTTYRRRSHSALYTYIKNKAEGTWGINISGNAASATKLQTSRKIWGQAFDGSADVNGALTGVTSITIGDCVITYDSANNGLKFSTGIYSEQYVSAKGANPSSGVSTGGASSIYIGSDLYTPDGEGIIHLPAYPTVPTSLKNPYALTIQRNGITQGVYDGSAAKTVNITVPTKVSELNNDANYLTAHQTLYALTIQGNGTELGVYTPNAAAKSINITAAGIGAAAATHTHTIAQVTGLQEALSDKYSSTVSRTANTVLAAPDDSDGTASFRKLVVNDLPSGVFHLRSNISSLNDLGDYNKQNGLVYIHNESAPSLAAETPFAYGCVLNMNYDAASANIGISYLGDMYFRNRWWSVGGGSWYAWRKILHSYNYTDYTVKKDGTGASGTWGINISGNADTATKLNNYYSTRPSNANLSPDGSGGMCKFLATSTMTSNKPAVDGHILHFHWDNTGGWDAQLMIPCNGNASNEPQWRAQNSGTWGSWISLVTSGTIGNYNAGSATKLQTARTLWGQSFDGTANVGGTITGTNFKINDTSSNPYLMLGTSWYVQLYQSMIQIGYGSYNSIKVDSSGNLILPTSSRRIYFNGSTSDNQCIVYDNSSGRLSVGSSAAKGFNVGDLLVSSAWADYTLVPTNGIYSKGDIYSAGAITAKASSSDIRLKRDLTEYDALSIVNNQRSVMYHWNETAKRNSAIFDDDDWHYGLIAQELQREHPQLVKDVFGDYLTIDYERLIPILWRAVQQLAKRNEELEQMINERRKAA